jgi:hypothetical protein
MSNLNTIQQDIVELTPEAQQIIFNLIDLLKTHPKSSQQSNPATPKKDWSDFIGCMEAEPDLSKNYKTYLSNELEQKYANR